MVTRPSRRHRLAATARPTRASETTDRRWAASRFLAPVLTVGEERPTVAGEDEEGGDRYLTCGSHWRQSHPVLQILERLGEDRLVLVGPITDRAALYRPNALWPCRSRPSMNFRVTGRPRC